MVGAVAKLVIIFLLISVGVYVGYGQLEKKFLVIPSVVPPEVSQEKPVEEPRQVLQKTSNYQIIIARNIFEAVLEQKVLPKKKEPVKIEKKPEPTTLKLTLQGTVTGDEEDARAIIVDQRERKEDIYHIGDVIQNALITGIERGKIVLELNGKKQFLLINDLNEKGAGGNGGRVRSPVPSARSSSFVREPARSTFARERKRPPPVKPHRRIDLKQVEEPEEAEEAMEIEPVEQVESLAGEDPQLDVVPVEEAAELMGTDDEDVVQPEEPDLEPEVNE